MKFRPLSVAIVSCAFVLSGAAPLTPVAADDTPPPPPPAAGPVRIMFAGDSITQGFDGDYTWRYRLVREFARQHVAADFVGPHRYTYGGSNHYLVSPDPVSGSTPVWDSDHDALGGTQLVQQVTRIRKDMDDYTPDILISSLGTTDVIHGASIAQVISNWSSYIDIARQEAADHGQKLTIILGELMTIRIPKAKRLALNAAVRKLAAAKTTPDQPVTVYDLEHSGWNVSRHTYDGTHPTPTGETLIAQRIGWTLNALGVLPGAPQIWRSFVRWPPQLKPVLRIDRHGRLIVNWKRAKSVNKTQLMRMRITQLRSGRTHPTKWTRDTRLVERLQPGRYRISVRGMRGTMASTWGPVVTVRVPRH
jgi:hypothetical protein